MTASAEDAGASTFRPANVQEQMLYQRACEAAIRVTPMLESDATACPRLAWRIVHFAGACDALAMARFAAPTSRADRDEVGPRLRKWRRRESNPRPKPKTPKP